jgi:DNA polymerase III subunit alpha
MSKKFEYDCGCSFCLRDTNKLIFDADIDLLSLECGRTWHLLSEGNTKGCFQLESRLGRSVAKKLKPENIEQLSALIAILRPGCLEAIRDGKSVTNHYIDKKNGEESVDYFHPSLEPILKSTYGEMIYQEQAMEIARVIAGFDLQEADLLRKAIGKKKPEEMAKIKTRFIIGAKKTNIVSDDDAEQIFSWIEKSQRYSFNKSHSVSYAMNAYLSAYSKAHFPRIFFASYLRFAKDKIDPQSEIKELIQNATEMNISVMTPDIRNMNEFFILKDKKIYFGLTDIKGLGKSVFDKLKGIVDRNNFDMSTITWLDLLLNILLNINSTAAKSLIESGATKFIPLSRSKMLFDLNIVSDLTKKEILFILDNKDKYDNCIDAMNYLLGYGKVNKNRRLVLESLLKTLVNPPYSLEDSIEWISDSENNTLGYNITCSRIDIYDISMTNTTCKDFKNRHGKNDLIIGGEIDFINVTKTKNGKNKGAEMGFVTLTDNTGSLDSIVFFPEQYAKYKHILFTNNIIILKGARSRDGNSFIVEKAYVAKS